MRLLSAIRSLPPSNPLKVANRLPYYCCYWIPLLSSVLGSAHAFQPPLGIGVRPYHPTRLFLEESRHELEQLRVADLKEKLKERGLKVGGKKEELINRLLSDKEPEATTMPRRSPRKAAAKATTEKDDTVEEPQEEEEEKPKKRARKTKAKKEDEEDDSDKEESPKKKKKQEEQRITDVDEIPKLWSAEKAKENGSYSKLGGEWNGSLR